MNAATKPVAWSISSLESFETCPRRYQHLRVIKDVADKKGVDADWGLWVHKQMENRIRDNTPLPVTLSKFEALAAPIANAPGEKIVEGQLAIDESFTPCTWFAKNTWCRAVVDAGIVKDDQAVLLDWKTGKQKPDTGQLALSAAMTMAHYPQVETVKTAFVWLKDDKTDKAVYTRADLGSIWEGFLPRVSRLKSAYSKTHFPPKPSGLCRKHCPVPKHLCEFNGT